MTEAEKIKLVCNKERLAKKFPDLRKILKPYLKPDCFNILLYMHLGDDFFRSYYVKDIEQHYKTPVHLIIAQNQEVIMKLWGIKNYTVVDWKKDIIPLKRYFDNPMIFDLWCVACVDAFKSTRLSSKLKRGDLSIIYLSNNTFSHQTKKHGLYTTVTQFICDCLGLPRKKVSIDNINKIMCTDGFDTRIKKIADLNKIILFSPETKSDDMLDGRIWNHLANKLISRGYTIIENVMDKKFHINNAINIDMKMQDLLWLGMNCRAIFSLRSGLCDVLVGKRDNLHVLWHGQRHAEMGHLFSFTQNFDLGKRAPIEHIMHPNAKIRINFDNVNLARGIKKKWLPCYMSPIQKIKKWFKNHKLFGQYVVKTPWDNKTYFNILYIPVFKKKKNNTSNRYYLFGIRIYKKRKKC